MLLVSADKGTSCARAGAGAGRVRFKRPMGTGSCAGGDAAESGSTERVMIRLDRSLLCAVRTSDVDCRQQESTVSASNAPVGITNRLTRIHSQPTHHQARDTKKVRSSQVKSSQVQISNGGRARRLWGARRRERSGGRGAAQLAWLDSPEPGLYPHRLLLDHRGAPDHKLRAFFRKSTVRQCNIAPGRRWELSGACTSAATMG